MNAAEFDRAPLAETDDARQLARDQLSAIKQLYDTDGFTGYWMGQLGRKKAAFEQSFKYDPPSSCSPEERETLRRLMLFCEELEKMPVAHAAAADALLSQPRQ